jgi:hypothetical protein
VIEGKLNDRLSGYILVFLVLGTAYLGGAQSMWARRIEGVYRVAGFIAYWIGLPAIGLGVLLRIRSVTTHYKEQD